MYPDLRTLPPRDLELDRADITADGSGNFHNVLRFSNTVWNVGTGKLVMRGRINSSTKDGTAYQRIYDDAGGFTDVAVGRFYWHAEHSHYHYDDWGRYQLFTRAEYDSWVANGRPATLPSGVEVGTKTTSCVMDEEFIKGLANTPYPAVFPSSGCMPDANNDLWEGISPGWGDTYDYWRYEQWIDLGANGNLGDGDYVLRSVTDDKNLIHESANKGDTSRENQVDNEGVTRFSVSGGRLVDTNAPTGTVTVNNVDSQTRSTNVTVKVLGRDDLVGPNDSSNVDTVQLSNDGVTWKSFGYTGLGSTAQSIAWNLADPAAGGNGNGGTKTVYAKFRDRTGKWSENETDTIELALPDTSTSKYAQAVLADTPVSYWRLGETGGTQALDERGTNSGVFTNGPVLGQPSLVSGETNRSATFDGTNDHVRVPASSSLNFTNRFSVEAWIKPAAIPASGGWASVVTKPEAYSIQFNGPRLEFTVIQSGTRQRVQAPAGAVVAGQTYHVVGTFDGVTQRIYLNGVEVGARALSGSASTTTSALYMASWSGGNEYFRGGLDDVAVYGSTLTPARVQAHHAAAGGGTTPPPPVTVAAPTNLAASPASPYAVDVRWTDNATNEGNYVLERSSDASFSAPREITLPANATSYSDSGLDPSTPYWYRVKATSGSVSSSWSNTATTTTPTPPATNSYSQVVLGDGPSSYWRLSETSGTVASDQKTVNPGGYVNSPALGQPSLLTSDTQNRALGLDGVNDQMRVPAAASLNLTSAITLETVIQPASIPSIGFASVLSKAEAYSLQFNSGRMEFTVMQSGYRRRLQAPSGAVVAGRRYHVVGTFDGVTQRLYLNGVQVASQALSGTATIYGSNLYVGSWNGTSEFFNGVIDEAAVYARTLSAAQVKSHYDSAVAAPPSGTTTSSVSALSAPATTSQTAAASSEPSLIEVLREEAPPAPAPFAAAAAPTAAAPASGPATSTKPRKQAKKKPKPKKRCNKRALRAGGKKAAAARRQCRGRR